MAFILSVLNPRFTLVTYAVTAAAVTPQFTKLSGIQEIQYV